MSLFKTGTYITATDAAIAVCLSNQISPLELLGRHISGDWGDISEEELDTNVCAIQWGNERIVSCYKVGEDNVWVITDANLFATSVSLQTKH